MFISKYLSFIAFNICVYFEMNICNSIELGTATKKQFEYVFSPYFLVHSQIFFVTCIQSSKSTVFIISLSAIFHTIDDILILQKGFNFHFSMPVSLVQWRGKTGVFYDKFQVFFNSSVSCSIVAPSYASICGKVCFTKLQNFILISFFGGILLS